MSVDSATLARGFADSSSCELMDAWQKITHCLEQLDDEQIWIRRDESMNSIANLLLHLDGNLRQWIVAGVGGAIDDRNRPLEFAERERISGEKLIGQLQQTIAKADASIRRQSAAELLRVRRIQGFEVSGLDAIIASVSHFRGHSQEIVHMTRSLLGRAYVFDFVPQTPEQGATC